MYYNLQKYELNFIVSSDLRFVFNILSSLVIVHAGKRDKGCKCPLSPIATGLGELIFLSVRVAPGAFIRLNMG